MNILGKVWHFWKKIGLFMGDLIARVVLTIFYFTLFLPFGLGTRIWGDPLGIHKKGEPAWLDRKTGDQTLQDAWRLS